MVHTHVHAYTHAQTHTRTYTHVCTRACIRGHTHPCRHRPTHYTQACCPHLHTHIHVDTLPPYSTAHKGLEAPVLSDGAQLWEVYQSFGTFIKYPLPCEDAERPRKEPALEELGLAEHSATGSPYVALGGPWRRINICQEGGLGAWALARAPESCRS